MPIVAPGSVELHREMGRELGDRVLCVHLIPSMQPFVKHLLSICCVPDPALGTRDPARSKADKTPSLGKAQGLVEETDNHQITICMY